MPSIQYKSQLILEYALPAFVVNVALNAGIAWLLFRRRVDVPLAGQQGLIADAIVTMFLVAFISAWIVIPLVRLAMRQGRLAPRPATDGLLGWFSGLPLSLWLRSIIAGVLSAIVWGAVVCAGLLLLDKPLWQGVDIVWLKALYTGVLGSVTSPLLAMWTLAERHPR